MLEADCVISTLPVWNVLRVVPEGAARLVRRADPLPRPGPAADLLAGPLPGDRRAGPRVSTRASSRPGCTRRPRGICGFMFNQTAMDPTTAPPGTYLYVAAGSSPARRASDERYLSRSSGSSRTTSRRMYPGLAKPIWRRRHLVLRAVLRGDPEARPGRHVPAALAGAQRGRPVLRLRDVPQPRHRRRPRGAGRADRGRGLPRRGWPGSGDAGATDGGRAPPGRTRRARHGRRPRHRQGDRDEARGRRSCRRGQRRGRGCREGGRRGNPGLHDRRRQRRRLGCDRRDGGRRRARVRDARHRRRQRRPDPRLHAAPDERRDVDLVLDVALKGTFYVCRSAARLLRRKEAEHNRKVVNISSINGVYGVAFNANYSAARQA